MNIAYTDEGAGEVIIMIHGSPGSSENFAQLIPLFTDQYRVIAIDLPGFGYSSTWVTDYSIRAHARYINALMEDLEIDHAHLFGYSMGSGVAIEMNDLFPEKIKSIAVYGGIGIQEGEGSGDYYFEHMKYGTGYVLAMSLGEITPHFWCVGKQGFQTCVFAKFLGYGSKTAPQ